MNPRKPDTVTVAVSRVDGGLTILRIITTEYRPPNDEERAAGLERVANWTIDPTPEYVDAIIAKHDWQGPQAPVSWRFVPDDIVDENTDRTFRDAWRDSGGGKPDVDMAKARGIHRARLRRMRAPMLESLDAEYMRADETGDQQAKRAIAKRKQALRDVTDDPAIEVAMTPDELKAVVPDALRG